MSQIWAANLGKRRNFVPKEPANWTHLTRGIIRDYLDTVLIRCFPMRCSKPKNRDQKVNANFFLTKIFDNPSSNVTLLKNAPTCYRAPKWPDPEFPRKIPKQYTAGRNSGTPRKYPENTKKKSVFSGYLGGKFWESRISAQGVFFLHFSWKFRVGPSRGSVAGRGVLNTLIGRN